MFLFLIFFLKEILCTLKMNIPHNRDKCFIEKFLKKSTIFVKYDVSGYDKNLDDDELLLILNGITIFIKSDNNQNVYIKYLNETKGKIAFDIRKEGEYRICVRFYSKTIATKLSDNVVIGLKIKKGYGKFRISSNLKKTDVIQFDKSIRNSGNNIIELQKEIEEMIKEEKINTRNTSFRRFIFYLKFNSNNNNNFHRNRSFNIFYIIYKKTIFYLKKENSNF